MYRGKILALVIPARNEAQALPSVLKSLPRGIDYIIVVDNGSHDKTPAIAHSLGAIVVHEPVAGYGRACQAACRFLESVEPDIIAFADGDGSNDIDRMMVLIDPIIDGQADFVLERRVPVEQNALNVFQKFGNRLITFFIHLIWGHRYHDLGPMRAMMWPTLKRLHMQDENYGWTVEMQIKAIKQRLRIQELELPYRSRVAGRSKVSGSIKGSVLAGSKMIWVIIREVLSNGGIKSEKRLMLQR